ncbi:hypothetical protein PF008_g24732 [Phytophthora fragariae]|uniref:Integrase catalytic domain-containing protein n=1 Tax=Phytophthora fragariae TaxID=53985 RepID=A0A6G0QM18_9STRA|nr:hypothetical protein PF008_g24732 [Phytophthora fragariae]
MGDTSTDHDDDPMNLPRANDMPGIRNTSTDTDNAEVADVRVAADDHAARNDDCGAKTTEVPKTTDATTTRSPTKPSPPTTRRCTKAATMGTDAAVTSQPTKTGASTVTNKKPRATEVLQNTTNAQKTAVEQRRQPTYQESPAMTLQLTDEAIVAAQGRSRLVQKMKADGAHRGMKVAQQYGLVLIDTKRGKRIILPPELWPISFKESHDSVWAGHLRAPHTYERIARMYWWPDLLQEVKRWVRGCQDCGSRKARPREVIPPLRSLRGGDACDRWALDVAGPFPRAGGGERYVIAAVEYVTRYVVAVATERHTAEHVAEFLMKEVVLKFGVFRELLTDGAPELTGRSIEQLVLLLQAEQTNPVPYRPQMIGLVERFHRTWKDTVSLYMHDDKQDDWEMWVAFAVFAYNSGRHTTVALSPNELMIGRKLRSPNDLLRSTGVTEAGELTQYHKNLLQTMKCSQECAEHARLREQNRQAKYYNRRVKVTRTFKAGDRVWMYRPPKGPKATKFVHRWMGPMRIVSAAGYENYLVRREDKNGELREFIAHVSFLTTYHESSDELQKAAADIEAQLNYEGEVEREDDDAETGAVAGTATATARPVTGAAGKRRRRPAATSEEAWGDDGEQLVEISRRRRRNKGGHYVLEFKLRLARRAQGDHDEHADADDDATRWVSLTEYNRLFDAGRVVEDSGGGEGV